MNYDRTIANAILGISLVAVALIMTTFLGNYFTKTNTLKEQSLLNEAVRDCSMVSQSTWKDFANNAEVTEPVKTAYERCLTDMGYEVPSMSEATDSAEVLTR